MNREQTNSVVNNIKRFILYINLSESPENERKKKNSSGLGRVKASKTRGWRGRGGKKKKKARLWVRRFGKFKRDKSFVTAY